MLDFPRWKIAAVLLVCLYFAYAALPNFLSADQRSDMPEGVLGDTVNLGLDLRGGVHLLYEIDFSDYLTKDMQNLRGAIAEELKERRVGYKRLRAQDDHVTFNLRRETLQDNSLRLIFQSIDGGLTHDESGDVIKVYYSDAALSSKKVRLIEQSIEIIGRRVNELGTTEPTIQRQGDNRIIVQVPGLQDPQKLKDIIGKTASMTFHLVNTEITNEQMLTGNVPLGTKLLKGTGERAFQNYAVFSKVELTGDMLTSANATYDQGQPVVSFAFNSKGARRFGEITKENVNRPFAIVLDNEVITAPNIRVPILDGRGIIEGGFTVESANDLALLLRAGALPAPLNIAEERTVGPSLGSDSIAAGTYAAMVAIALVVVFMFVSYGLFGLFSNIALLMNMVILLGALSLLQATLTLPGIAGIVLTLGMAVDANVLIFERIREEIARGRTAFSAVENGFKSAFGTIMDSNITTLMAASVLFLFGTGTIKGFAVTLSLGILSSMFTAIMLTRMQVVLWLKKRKPSVIPI